MLTTIKSCELSGVDCNLVWVEVHVAKGHPNFNIIGLPDTAIKEAAIRIYTAMKNSELDYPYTKRIVINLAPVNLKKEGPSYDMAFIAGILVAQYELEFDFKKCLMVGELSLNGEFRHVRGVVSVVEFAKRTGIECVFLPAEDACEAAIIKGVKIFPVKSIRSLLNHLKGEAIIDSQPQTEIIIPEERCEVDFAYIKGQSMAKRAMEVAAAGMHNILMSGSPGSGKTMMAQALPGILPQLLESEMIEITKIYSVANLLPKEESVVYKRPFRAPHHSSSSVSLAGGGRNPRPGEVTLAHRGVLFLDEFPEFTKISLEILRQPMEDGVVTISRASGSVTYPARFMLVAAQNPCPCGYYSDPQMSCKCSIHAINRYRNKISGPLLDRIDLFVPVQRITYSDLQKSELNESSADVAKRVLAARLMQIYRFENESFNYNSEMGQKHINKYCQLKDDASEIMKRQMESQKLSARAYYRVLRVARTIADLEGSSHIEISHVAEALQYRLSE